jgi:hypothetical protein
VGNKNARDKAQADSSCDKSKHQGSVHMIAAEPHVKQLLSSPFAYKVRSKVSKRMGKIWT